MTLKAIFYALLHTAPRVPACMIMDRSCTEFIFYTIGSACVSAYELSSDKIA